ncbi:MAG: NFACT RNA binding domain-containing protein [Arcobacteraceae bacterium]|nr:NFACT RNA binding domain-containing protein [Arcobacteraceae bacterium]
MKYYLLKAFCEYLAKFSHIKHIKRVENNTLKIEFSRDETFYFDMTRGNSLVYIKENNENIKKDFKSPFDVLLQKKFTNSQINKSYLLNNDKILCIEVTAKSSYKKEIVTLQFEFTGKNTNTIIVDENRVILEALRHIDEQSSSRVVKVGIKLLDVPKPNFIFQNLECDDIVSYLKNNYQQKEDSLLHNIKIQKTNQLLKEKEKLENIILHLEDKEMLKKQADEMYGKANLLLANLYQIKPYEKEIELIDFEGEKIKILLDDSFSTPSNYVDFLFKSGKKLKQKIENQYLEYENLSQKVDFLSRLIEIIKSANSIDEIEFYLPKKDKNIKKTKKMEPYQSFFIDGYKIMLGRDERENIYLLENSKANDFWFHLQGRVSAHVIVQNTKKELPEYIIEEASKICARFSSDSKGVFVVDYTQRRNIKIQSKANVLYNPYYTTVVKI